MFCPGELNIADLPSRGCSGEALLKSDRSLSMNLSSLTKTEKIGQKFLDVVTQKVKSH